MADVETSRPARLDWVDRARGAAILLVVLHHCVLVAASSGVGGERLLRVDGLLAGMRMPLFFFVSGTLAARAVQRSWQDLVRGKVFTLVWLYLLWLVVAAVVYSVVPYARDTVVDRPQTWLGVAHGFDDPRNSLWYLYALALFSVLGRLLRRVPTALALAGAALVSTAFLSLEPLFIDNHTWRSLFQLFPFFLAGSRLVPTTTRAAVRLPAWVGVAALVVSPALVVLSWRLPSEWPRPGLHLVVGGLAVLGGVVLAASLPATRPVQHLTRLGRTTLPVYVLHMPVLSVVVAVLGGALAAVGSTAPALSVLVAGTLLVLTLTLTLLARRALVRVPWLFALPGWARVRADGARRPTAASVR